MEDPFKERWKQIERQYYEKSELRNYKTYSLKKLIVKANDDLR